jgi:hypothetical protein
MMRVGFAHNLLKLTPEEAEVLCLFTYAQRDKMDFDSAHVLLNTLQTKILARIDVDVTAWI